MTCELRRVAICASLRLLFLVGWIVLAIAEPAVALPLTPALAIVVILVALYDQLGVGRRDG